MLFAKALIAGVGSAATAALAIVPPHTLVWQIATVLSAAATTILTYRVPNAKPPGGP